MHWLRALLPDSGWLTGPILSVTAAAAWSLQRIISNCSRHNHSTQTSKLHCSSSSSSSSAVKCNAPGIPCNSQSGAAAFCVQCTMQCSRQATGVLARQLHAVKVLQGYMAPDKVLWQQQREAALHCNEQQLFWRERQQQQWQQLRVQQLLPFLCATSSSRSCMTPQRQLLLQRSVFTAAEHRRVGVSIASMDELVAALQGLGLHPAAVTAVTTAAPSWPSLSKDSHEIPHRILRLQDMVGSAAAAADMLVTHPHLLTRPPAALEQQLVNLALWLRLPIAGSCSSSSLLCCQDLMDLVRSSPGILFLSKQQVESQLQAIQQLLHLPSLPFLAEAEVAFSEQLLAAAEAEHHQQEAAAAAGGGGFEQVEWAQQELQQWKQQQHKQVQQVKAALRNWRRQQQQQQQQQQHMPVAAAAAADGAVQLPWDSWPGRLVCHAPDWLFLDPQTVLSRRIDYLARLVFGDSIIAQSCGNSSSSSSSSSKIISPVRKMQALLLDAPQLISVNSSQIPAKIRTLSKVITQHPAYALMQQQQQQQQGRDMELALTRRSQLQQSSALVVPFLLQNPNLLVQPARLLEHNGKELLQRMPLLPLYHFLLLLPQQQLQWQQLEYLQHMQMLPPQPGVPLAAAAAAAQPPSSNSSSCSTGRHTRTHLQQYTQDACTQPCTAEQLQLATSALSLSASQFSMQFPLYPAWQSALSAAEQSSRDWRAAWGWLEEFYTTLTGPSCETWLQGMSGKWQRLLLLAGGPHWVVPHSTQAMQTAAAAVLVGSRGDSSSSSTSKQFRRRRSRVTNDMQSGAAATAAAAVGSPDSQAGSCISSSELSVSLQQVAELPGQQFPFRPVVVAGPLAFDLPEAAIQQLLVSGKSAADHTLTRLSKIWQQLVAAAALSTFWQQQLGDVAVLLPQALVAAGWKLPAAVTHIISSSDSSTSSWVDDSMDSRSDSSLVAAAAAARQQFWQHLQQRGVADRLVARLQYLHQTGLTTPGQHMGARTATAAAAAPVGIHPQASSTVDPQQLWSVLTATDAAFTAAFPTFKTWSDLTAVVQGRSAWAAELDSFKGQQLVEFMQRAAAAWNRISFLVADTAADHSSSSSLSGLWQGISLTDVLSLTEQSFLEMFPDARYTSWQALAQLSSTGSSSSSSTPATYSQPDQTAPPAAAAGGSAAPLDGGVMQVGGASTGGGTSSSSQVAAQARGRLASGTAAQRLQLVQAYAAFHPAWEAAVRSWTPEAWAAVARVFVPLRARRLEFILQMAEPCIERHTTSNNDSSTCNSTSSSILESAVVVPDLYTAVSSANKNFEQKFPLYKPWYELGLVVQPVPQWAAEWQGLRGARLEQVLSGVVHLQAPDPEAISQQAYQEHMALLQQKIAQHRDSSSSSSADLSKLLKHAKLPRIGVTGTPGQSSSSSDMQYMEELLASSSSSSRKKKRKHAGVVAADVHTGSSKQQQQLSGLSLALHRLAYIRKLSYTSAAKELPLVQVLTMPQLQLWEMLPGLDPGLTAAKAQGTAAAEAHMMEQLYPWLGRTALKPEQLQGLSPAGQRLLDDQAAGGLLLLQRLAHSWPDWEAQLQTYTAATLEEVLKKLPSRVERLQVLVRAGIQQYNSIRSVLKMEEGVWRGRYPIAVQLAEVQAAAAGVPAWERTLSHTPSGQQLLQSIDKLHVRRGRLAWLREQGLTQQSALQVLRMAEEGFVDLYPDYPGDAAMHHKLGTALGNTGLGQESESEA